MPKGTKWLEREANIFFNAWVFFTRLPTPHWVTFSSDYQRASIRYFPLVGLLIGCVAAAVFAVGERIFPLSVALLLSMFSTVWLTGGLHEDGLADSCDAFGGGWSREDVLRIMKDSRLGTYGALGLFFILLSKFVVLQAQATDSHFLLVLVAGHSVSRFASLSLLYSQVYVQDSDASKSRMLASEASLGSVAVGALFAAVPVLILALLAPLPNLLLALAAVAAVRWYLARLYHRRLGGFTGDCLGALQQVAELFFYLAWLAHW